MVLPLVLKLKLSLDVFLKIKVTYKKIELLIEFRDWLRIHL
jgi:hypothetical protein